MPKSAKSMITIAVIALVVSAGVVIAAKKVQPIREFLD